MEIPAKLMKFKYHILVGSTLVLILIILCYLAPSFLDIVKYFWPLLLSTALFLVAVVVFGRISPPPELAPGEKAGEGLLDYVAGQPEQVEAEPILEDVAPEVEENVRDE